MTSVLDYCVLPDSNGVIDLLSKGVRPKVLDDLCRKNRPRIVDGVARELRRYAGGQSARFVNRNKAAIYTPVQAVLDEITRLAHAHVDLFSTDGKAADPTLVATAIYYHGAVTPYLVVSDDHGVQAVCFLESVPFIPCRAYRALLTRATKPPAGRA